MAKRTEVLEKRREESGPKRGRAEKGRLPKQSSGERLDRVEADIARIDQDVREGNALMASAKVSLERIEAALEIKEPGEVHGMEAAGTRLAELVQRREELETQRRALQEEIADGEGRNLHGAESEAGQERERAIKICDACIETLLNAAGIEGLAEASKEKFNKLVQHITAWREEASLGMIDAEKISIATVAIIDVLETDNIAKKGAVTAQENELKNSYRRDYGQEFYWGRLQSEGADANKGGGWSKFTLITRGEEGPVAEKLTAAIKEINEKAETEIKFQPIANSAELINLLAEGREHPAAYYIEDPISAEELLSVQDALAKSPSLNRSSVSFPVRLNGNISGYYLFAGNDVRQLFQSHGAITDQPADKKSFIPVQDRWLAFLQAGLVAPVDYTGNNNADKKIYYLPTEGSLDFGSQNEDRGNEEEPASERADKKEGGEENAAGESAGEPLPELDDVIGELLKGHQLERSRVYLRRKLEAFLRNDDSSEALERYLERDKDHYRAFFKRNGVEPAVVLTRGGFTANEAAIKTIYRLTEGGDRKAFTMPGWYYENAASVSEDFEATSDLESANILFIDSAPNGTIPTDLVETYDQRRDELIARFVQLASSHPGKRYFMAIDKTTNPLYESFATPAGVK